MKNLIPLFFLVATTAFGAAGDVIFKQINPSGTAITDRVLANPSAIRVYGLNSSAGTWRPTQFALGTGFSVAGAFGSQTLNFSDPGGPYQPLDTDLTVIAGLTPSNNDVLQRKSGAWANRTLSQYWTDLMADPGPASYSYTALPFTINTDKRLLGRDNAIPPGVAQEISIGTSLSLSSSSLNAIQDIRTTATPTFAGLTSPIGATTPNTGAFTSINASSNISIASNQINEYATNSVATISVNFTGYAGGTTQFRNLDIYDGKNTVYAQFAGSAKTLSVTGGINSTPIGAATPSTGDFSGRLYLTGGDGAIPSLPTYGSKDFLRYANNSNTNVAITSGAGNVIGIKAYQSGDGTAYGQLLFSGSTRTFDVQLGDGTVGVASVAVFTPTGLNSTAIGATTPSTVAATTLQATTSVLQGGGMKHQRVTTGSISAGSTALVTLTWSSAFSDANVTVTASVVDSTGSSLSLSVVHVESITASAVAVRVINNAVGSLTGTLHVIALRD